MPSKRLKKPFGKRKQNGKKSSIKGQTSKQKQKSEVEVPSKEQLSELEKEIFNIQISELEGKLSRKMHLCSYMEEEMAIYKKLYSGKLFLKSESMKLLNEAFQDFASEIFLLDQEYRSMQSMYSNLSKRQEFCIEYQRRVDMLNALGTKLEESLSKSEKCSDELPIFMKAFAELEKKAAMERQKYDCVKEKILRNFDECLLSIQKEINLKVDDIIHDRNLKLDLLPLSWQALFCSGWLSKSWLDSSLKCLERQQCENMELKKEYDGLLQCQIDVPDIIGEQERQVQPERKKSTISEDSVQQPELLQQCLYLETQILHQQNKISSMKAEMVNLEKAIQSLEISGDTYFEKSYLIQIVHKAGSLLKQEFET